MTAKQGSQLETTAGVIAEVVRRPLPVGSEELIDQLRARLGGQRAVYLSTPITTGPRLLEALRSTDAASQDGYLQQVRDEVVAANIRGVGPLRERLSAAFSGFQLIDPTQLEVSEWEQADYHRHWVEVINRLVRLVVFAPGWHLSTGCSIEFVAARVAGLPCYDAQLSPITHARAIELLTVAIEQLREAGLDDGVHRASVASLLASDGPRRFDTHGLKDDLLARIAQDHNVASFLSVGQDLELRHSAAEAKVDHLAGMSLESAVEYLMHLSPSRSVNVRTFRAEAAKGTPFFYGVRTVPDVLEIVRSQAAAGFYTIVNETIDVHDGGVSGVSLGGLLEFAPDDTPRVVEGGATVVMPIALGRKILSTVYTTPLDIPSMKDRRYEFSVHPQRVGHRSSHLIIWEEEAITPVNLTAPVEWPNDFSRLLGDKTFGLLVADACGGLVPRTKPLLRRLAPFEFGVATGSHEWWLRTTPTVQTPGHYTTSSRWVDPYALLAKEDDSGLLAGVLAQEGVDSIFSGATALEAGGNVVVEGIAGTGEQFMLGQAAPQALPDAVVADVVECVESLTAKVGGPIRIEWAHDGASVWVLQMHRVAQQVDPGVLCPGTADEWIQFHVSDGLGRLQEIITKALESSSGIEVIGRVGIASHVGDLVRAANVPTRFGSLD